MLHEFTGNVYSKHEPTYHDNNTLKIYDYITDNKCISLPLEIEKRIETLKEEYLKWLYIFGESLCYNKKVKEFLMIDDLSMWWLTLIAEKSFFKTPSICKILKLRTIEQLAEEKGPKKIHIVSSDKDLKKPLSRWARKKGIKIVWKPIKKVNPPKSTRRKIYEGMPHLLRAIIYLYVYWWRALRRVRKKVKPSKANQATIITYFPNIDWKEAKRGIFKSYYWGSLNEILREMGIHVNWVFIYDGSTWECSFDDMLKLKEKFNNYSKDKFFLVEEFITLKLLLNVLKDYIKLYFRGVLLLKRKFFKIPGSEIDFYGLYKEDWKSSVIGTVLVENILWYRIFQKMFSVFPKQKFCLYPCEMMAWEKALCKVCKDRGIPTIGFQHASLRVTDFRYFYYPEIYKDSSLPLPDILAVNGGWSKKQLLKNGYPKEKIFLVEALRSLYLCELKEDIKTRHPKTFLVITSMMKDETEFQLSLLRKVIDKLDFERVWIKFHPSMPVNEMIKKFSLDKKVEIKVNDIYSLFKESDFVFTSNDTTASVESICCGLPTLSTLSPTGVNMSPLLGLGVPFISSTDELLNLVKNPPLLKIKEDIFLLDKSLIRWKSLLKRFYQ